MGKERLPRRSSEEWERHIRTQEQSGQSVSQYCKDHSLGDAAFYTWRRRLKNPGSVGGNGFIQLQRERPEVSVAHIEIPNGWRITINGAMDEEALTKMLRAVKRA